MSIAERPAGVEARLREVLGDRVRSDLGARALFTSDASLYRALPSLVVEPADIGELTTVVRICGETGTPLTMRGAGTSIAGNALGTGVIVATRSLDRIVELNVEAGYAVVEAGVVLDDLDALAAPHGLRVGPDPSTHSRCTIGGMIGNNACGSHSVVWGTTAENVLGVDMIRSDGSHVRMTSPGAPDRPHDPDWPELDGPLADSLRAFTGANAELIRRELPPWPRRVSGYALDWLLPEQGPDPAKAMVGTEGTCAILARATVRLVRPPATRALLVLGFRDDIEGAGRVPDLLKAGPFTVESLSAELLALAGARTEDVGLPSGGAWLMVEARADDAAGAREHAQRLAAAIGRTLESSDVRYIEDSQAQVALWKIREDGAGYSARLADGTKAWPGFEDSAVPPERLGAYLSELRALLDRHGMQAISYGHYGEGCIHLRIGFGLGETGGAERYEHFMSDAADLVVRHGGSLSGEHGDGRSRGPLLERQFSPEMREAFAAFRSLWDPAGALNPAIIVDPPSITDDLRVTAPTLLQAAPTQAFSEDDGDFRSAVDRCIGVGRCVSTQGSTLMCPSFRATRDEQNSTRGRARLLQEMVAGSLANDGWGSTEVRDALDLCLACRGCVSQCPTGVDMASYKSEFLDHHYRRRLRPLSHYSLGWLPLWLKLSSRLPRLVNAITRSRLTGGLFARLAGIAPSRGIPPVARRTFTRDWRPRNHLEAAPHGKVVLWPDTFNNHLTPDVAHDAVRVLEAAGFEAIVPTRSVCCGLTWHTTGQLGMARRVLKRSLGASELAGDEPVVVLEPSCATLLKSDLPELLPDDPRAISLSRRVVTLAELLDGIEYVAPPSPPDTRPVIAQPHCHQQSVLGLDADRRVCERNG
ncbi:MAG: FAD-binding and (Fe-S)-binding domain-containing protein, partial [Chloroflexota bacterium]|nr:FAD-binding and (Fe-S)-binding domain-containing protein [Chloroflexota bacterium]